MGILRPATPGFLVTLAATVLLALVVFNVPYLKSIYFLKASLSSNGVSGSLFLGTLGYCVEFSGKTQCSSPSVGYEFDPNQLLGNELPIKIPSVVVKWVTYALVLHIVALGLAAISALFGLLAHVREMSMACLSSCVSGLAAAICLIAFIFDIVFFFLLKSRINSVDGVSGGAEFGTATWLTLAAWLLLFFSGVFYAIGRCCIGRSGRSPSRDRKRNEYNDNTMPGSYADNSYASGSYGKPQDPYADTMRLAAVKAEADRKARAASAPKEQGLPAFQEYERTPLRSNDAQYIEEDESRGNPYAPTPAPHQRAQSQSHNGARYPGGYAGGAPGGRAVDNMYGASPSTNTYGQYPNASRSPPVGAANIPPGASYGVGSVVSPASSPYPQQSAPSAAGPAQSFPVGAVFGGAAAGAAVGAAAAGAHGRQASHDQPYSGHPQRQQTQTSSYHDPYAPQATTYDAYQQVTSSQSQAYRAQSQASHSAGTGRSESYYSSSNPSPMPTPYGGLSSGLPTGQSYVTANDKTPRPAEIQRQASGGPEASYFGAAGARYTTSPPPVGEMHNPQPTIPAPINTSYGGMALGGGIPSSGVLPHSGGLQAQQRSAGTIHAPSPVNAASSGSPHPGDWNALGGADAYGGMSDSSHHDIGSQEAPPEYNPYEPAASTSHQLGHSLAYGGPPVPEKGR